MRVLSFGQISNINAINKTTNQSESSLIFPFVYPGLHSSRIFGRLILMYHLRNIFLFEEQKPGKP